MRLRSVDRYARRDGIAAEMSFLLTYDGSRTDVLKLKRLHAAKRSTGRISLQEVQVTLILLSGYTLPMSVETLRRVRAPTMLKGGIPVELLPGPW